MELFARPLFSYKQFKDRITNSPMRMPQPMSYGRGIGVGEFLALLIVMGFLVSSIYCMIRAKNRAITVEEIDIYKQYCWVVVSVVGGLALNGAMGRFTSSSYSSYGYQPYMPGMPQPGVPGQPQQPPYQDYGHGVMTTMAGSVADSEQDEDARNVEEE